LNGDRDAVIRSFLKGEGQKTSEDEKENYMAETESVQYP